MRILRFASLAVALAMPSAFAGTTDLQCPGNASACNDTIPSLGQFIIQITDPAVIAALAGSPPPGYDPASHMFVSPLLFDQNTVIGRSSPFSDGSSSDTNGVTVGVTGGGVTALTGVKDPSVVPVGFPSGTSNDEIATAILNLQLANGSGFTVTAGAASTSGPNAGVASIGEVESTGCANISNSSGCNDFPANSFFDVFAEVSIPGLGNFHNPSGSPLVVQNNAIPSLPPTVVYTHGQSSSVPILADNTGGLFTAGDQLGTFVLTGHGANYQNNAAGDQQFGQQMDTLIQNDSALNGEEQTFLESQIQQDDGLPEPSTAALLLGGFAFLGISKLRSR